MNRIKVLVSVVALLMACIMCSCSAVTDIIDQVESQVAEIEDELENATFEADIDIDMDDIYVPDNDEEVELYPLPAALFNWDDAYVATFGEVDGYEYDPEYSDSTVLVYDGIDYDTDADSIYITADKAEYMDGDPYVYYKSDVESFEEYVKDNEDYGEFSIGDEKTINVDGIEVSYFESYYPAYSSHFYETYAWTYVAAADSYVAISIESCVSEEGMVYDSEKVVTAVINAMVIGEAGDSVVETQGAQEETFGSDEPVGNEESDIIDAFR